MGKQVTSRTTKRAGSPYDRADPKRKPQTVPAAPDRIKRPKNAFMLFRQQYVADAKAKSTETKQNDLSKEAGVVWKSLSEDEQRPFYDMAQVEKLRHLEDNPGYVYKPSKKGTKVSRAKPRASTPQSADPSKDSDLEYNPDPEHQFNHLDSASDWQAWHNDDEESELKNPSEGQPEVDPSTGFPTWFPSAYPTTDAQPNRRGNSSSSTGSDGHHPENPRDSADYPLRASGYGSADEFAIDPSLME